MWIVKLALARPYTLVVFSHLGVEPVGDSLNSNRHFPKH
jgi:hypothetical protein